MACKISQRDIKYPNTAAVRNQRLMDEKTKKTHQSAFKIPFKIKTTFKILPKIVTSCLFHQDMFAYVGK